MAAMFSSHPRTRMAGIGKLGAFATAAGLLAAALALPAVGGSGMAVVATADTRNLRPAELVEPPLAEKTAVCDAQGNAIAQFYAQDRKIVPLSRISQVM